MQDVIPSDSSHKKLNVEITGFAVPPNPPHVVTEQPSKASRPIGFAPNSGPHPTLPFHSSDAPIRVSESLVHTHRESPHNFPPVSQTIGVCIEKGSLDAPGTHSRVLLNPYSSLTHA